MAKFRYINCNLHIREAACTGNPENYLWRVASYGSEVILVDCYKIAKRTPKGVRLEFNNKFVNLTAKKQWASETKTEAWSQFIHRKYRHIQILRTQLKAANLHMDAADSEYNRETGKTDP